MGKLIVLRKPTELDEGLAINIDRYIANTSMLDANLAAEEAKKARKRAENGLQEADSCRRKIEKLQRHNKWMQMRINLSAPIEKAYMALFAAIGGMLGMMLVISQVLEQHGPTVTVMGTMLAALAYVANGTFFAIIFGIIGMLHSRSIMILTRRNISINNCDIEKLEQRIDKLKERASLRTQDAERLELESLSLRNEAQKIRHRHQKRA